MTNQTMIYNLRVLQALDPHVQVQMTQDFSKWYVSSSIEVSSGDGILTSAACFSTESPEDAVGKLLSTLQRVTGDGPEKIKTRNPTFGGECWRWNGATFVRIP